MEWVVNNWQFLVGDILIPIITFILGIFLGKASEKRKAKAVIKGNNNSVYQNYNDMQKDDEKVDK